MSPNLRVVVADGFLSEALDQSTCLHGGEAHPRGVAKDATATRGRQPSRAQLVGNHPFENILRVNARNPRTTTRLVIRFRFLQSKVQVGHGGVPPAVS